MTFSSQLDIEGVTSFTCNVPTGMWEGEVNYCDRSMIQCVPECADPWSHISRCDICGNICCKKHTAHCDKCEKTLCFDCEFVDQLSGRYERPNVTLLVCDRCGTKIVKDHKGSCVEDRSRDSWFVQFCDDKSCAKYQCPCSGDESWLCAAHKETGCSNAAYGGHPKGIKRLKRDTDSRRCEYCGAEKDKLLVCGRCKSVFYCSADCQRPHWKKHKKTCKKLVKSQKHDESSSTWVWPL